jgi:hypothetical protein
LCASNKNSLFLMPAFDMLYGYCIELMAKWSNIVLHYKT